MTRKSLPLIIAISLLTSVKHKTAAEEPSIASTPASDLSSLVQTALNNSPTVQQRLADVQKAKGLRFQSTRSANPVAGYTASEIGNDARAGQQGVFWSQTFRRSEKLDLNDQIGRWNVEASTHAWRAEQQKVAGNVKIRWYAAAAASQQITLLQKLHDVLQNAVATTKSLADAGETARTPYLQARLELQRNQLNKRNAESTLEAARKQLAAVVGTTALDQSVQFSGLAEPLGVADEETYLADLFANSPELHLARARILQNQSSVCRQQVEPMTDLQTQFSVQYDDATNYTVSGVQLGVTLPLFDRNRGNISAANADYLRAVQEVRRMELKLTKKAARTYRDYTVANREVETTQSELMPLAQENLKATSQSFKVGEASYQSLLTAQRSYVELILSRINALRRVRQAEAMLKSYLLADEIDQ